MGDERQRWLENLGVDFSSVPDAADPGDSSNTTTLTLPNSVEKADVDSGSVSLPNESAQRFLQAITINPTTGWITPGEEPLQLTATGDYSDGTSELLTDRVEWHSTEPDHVAVDHEGSCTAQPGPGKVQITATYENVSGTASLSVVSLESLLIDPLKPSMAGGSQLQFKATGKYSAGPLRDLTKTLDWSTSEPDVVSIDGHGLASAKRVMGGADISAKTADGRFYATTRVSVATAILKSLTLEPANPPTIAGDMQFTAQGHYTSGPDQDETQAVEWSASPADVLEVDNLIGTKGRVSALKPGRARLTVTEKNSGVSASIEVAVALVVTPTPVLQTITISPSLTLLVGTRNFKALGVFSDGSTQDLTDQVKWSSSATDIVEMDDTGAATAQPKAGAATLKAAADGKVASLVVTVRPPVLQTISITADGPAVIGKQQNFQATGELSDGTSLVLTNKVIWISSDPTVIAIDKKKGTASVKSPGSATITAEEAASSVLGFSNIVVQPASGRGRLTSAAVTMLIQNLVYLASPKFHRAVDKPGPPRLRTAGEPSVDALLGQAADVVRLWSVPKTLPAALEVWHDLEPKLLALLKEAEDPKKLGFTPETLKPARDAIASIADYLSVQEVDVRLDQEVKDTPTPELSKELDARDLKKLEPALKVWREATQSSGKLARLPEMKKLSEILDLYYSASDPSEKLHAFQEAKELDKESTLPDLVAFLIHNCVSGGAAVTEAGIKAAEAAVHAGGGQEAEEALEALEKRLKLVKLVGGAVALFDLAKGTIKLIEGIEDHNWHDIAEGGATLALGTIGMGETVGAIEAGTSGTLTAATVAAWAAFDSILMAAEQARWAKQMKEQNAFKKLVADARKLVPIGKRMSAAVDLMHETETATDSVGSGNYDRYRDIANEQAAKIGNGLRGLLTNHIQRQSPDAVGGYPDLVEPVAPMLKKAYDDIDYKTPETLVAAFDATVTAIQEMLRREAETNDPG